MLIIERQQKFTYAADSLRSRLKTYFCRRCTRPDEAAMVEDCVQETLLRVARKLEDGEEIVNFEAFAMRTAKFVYYELLNQHRRERNREELVEQSSGSVAPVRPELEIKAGCVERCLMRLNETERALIEAWFAVPAGEAKIEKRRQIREQFDLTPSTLRVRIFRAINKLRACCRNCVQCEANRVFPM